jgi:hypothetical protein
MSSSSCAGSSRRPPPRHQAGRSKMLSGARPSAPPEDKVTTGVIVMKERCDGCAD